MLNLSPPCPISNLLERLDAHTKAAFRAWILLFASKKGHLVTLHTCSYCILNSHRHNHGTVLLTCGSICQAAERKPVQTLPGRWTLLSKKPNLIHFCRSCYLNGYKYTDFRHVALKSSFLSLSVLLRTCKTTQVCCFRGENS